MSEGGHLLQVTVIVTGIVMTLFGQAGAATVAAKSVSFPDVGSAVASAHEGDTVVVSSPGVPKPVAVRYGWADNPIASLYNSVGLPTSPFRTDDWD